MTEIPVNGGSYIYIIEKILFPSTIERFLDNLCPRIQSTLVSGPCGACGRISDLCEGGDTPVLDKAPDSVCFSSCGFHFSPMSFVLAAQRTCMKLLWLGFVSMLINKKTFFGLSRMASGNFQTIHEIFKIKHFFMLIR